MSYFKEAFMCKKCWLIVVILMLILGAVLFKFMIQGSTIKSSDNRLSLQINESERNLVLSEMRQFLEAVQQITTAISNEDMNAIVTSARSVGMGAQQGVPTSLMGKLPLEFKKLGFDTHTKFDSLALDAEQLGDPQHTLEQLSELMKNCVACHAVYRIN
jgi:hypothetical protein